MTGSSSLAAAVFAAAVLLAPAAASAQSPNLDNCSEAIRMNPQYALAYNNRGLVKRAKGDSAGGDADIALAKQLSPSLGN